MKSWIYIVLTMVLWGLIPILDKKGLSGEKIPPMLGMTVRVFASFIVFAIFVTMKHEVITELKGLSVRGILVFATSGIISTFLAQYFYYEALKDQNVGRIFPVLFAGSPVVGVIFSWLFLGEEVSQWQTIGCLLIAIGSAAMFF